MQVYRRISNPYMPQGTPDLTNAPSPHYAPGEIGCSFSDQNTGAEYLRAQLDSAATSSSVVGAVVAGQTAFWKDQTRGIVTNDKRQCDAGPSGAINRVAGIFQLAVSATPGVVGSDGNPVMYMCDLMVRGQMNVAAATALVGAQATVDTTADTARATYTTGVNTAPVSQVLGVFTSTTITANKAPMNVSIGFAE